MPKTLREERAFVRISGPLRHELEAAAAEEARPFAAMIRRILVEWAVSRRRLPAARQETAA
jgi:hypothetical protein